MCADEARKQERSPGVAAVLSLLVPGSGQLYNGQIGKGILVLLTWWLIVPWILGVVDAHSTAKKINDGTATLKTGSGCAIGLILGLGGAMIVVLILGLLAAIAIPNFVKARQIAMTKACIANLNLIEAAKLQWAAETGAPDGATPEWIDLVPSYLNNGIRCPRGGSYEIEDSNSLPTCSVGENNLPGVEDDHILTLRGE